MSRILIIAKGSFGDVFPMFAVARELQAGGHEVTCAVPRKHHDSVAAIGLHAIALRPAALGISPPTWLRRMTNKILSFNSAGLAEEYAELRQAAAAADLLIGNQIAFVTPLLAETLGRKWVYCAISPLAVYSASDPPLFPGLHASPFRDVDLPGLRSIERRIARLVARFWGREISRQRKRLGLPGRGNPMFEGKFSPDLNLFLCSPSFVRAQPDWPGNMRLTGFCWFEPGFLGNPQDFDALQRFLRQGDAPVLLLLGSDSRTKPGRYYHVGIEACRQLGLRVVAVADPRFHADLPHGDDILITGYLPYAKLIASARVVVHSAGIGTLGWCLRHGKFSILTPGAEDQFDNARRAQQLGYARVIPRRYFDADHLGAALRAHLSDKTGNQACLLAAQALSQEDGVGTACGHINALLGRIG
jgi:rhamnosyltransferase subunit B